MNPPAHSSLRDYQQTDCNEIIHLNKCAYFAANLLITVLRKINNCIDNKSQRDRNEKALHSSEKFAH